MHDCQTTHTIEIENFTKDFLLMILLRLTATSYRFFKWELMSNSLGTSDSTELFSQGLLQLFNVISYSLGRMIDMLN